MTTYDDHADALVSEHCERCLKLLLNCECEEDEADVQGAE